MSIDRSPGEWNLAVRQQAVVAQLSQRGLQSDDLEALLREAMVVAAETLDVGDVALFELLPGEGGLRGRAGIRAGRVLARQLMTSLVLPVGMRSLPGYVLQEGAPVVANDLQADTRFETRALDVPIRVRSAVAAPIAWDQRAFGVLCVYGREPRAWSGDDVHFVHAIANTMGLAIQRSGIEEKLRASSARLDLSLSAGGLGAWSWNVDGDAMELNGSALEMVGVAPGDFGGTGQAYLALVHPDDRQRLRSDIIDALESDTDHHLEYRIIRRDNGEVRWVESWGRLLGPDAAERHAVGVFSDITDRRRANEQREALLQAEQAARRLAEQAQERLAFLAEASTVLASSLDPELTLEQLAELCVPKVGEVCFIDLVDEQGALAEAAGRGATEVLLYNARSLRKRRTELGAAAPTKTGIVEALGGGGVLYDNITDELMEMAAADADHLRMLKRMDARSTIMSPMLARGRALGVLTLIRTGAAPRYDRQDLAFVEDLAARAALAIDNGRLFHSRNRVARSLQAALLPPALPEVPGIALAARYDVAEADVEIGGDFYDVIPAGPGSWGIAVGDVCGRGPDAAALTGLVRHSLHSAVLRERVPSQVLTLTNQAMMQQIDDAKFCTAAYLRLDVLDAETGLVHVSVSSAGHPRPVLVRADGSAEPIECAGTLLGVVSEPSLIDAEVTLQAGDAVVLYTDGVTEARRGNEQFGEARVVEALAGFAGQPAEVMASGLEDAVASFRRSARDDTAIVVLQAVARP